VVLSDTKWSWVDKTELPTVTNNGYKAVMSVTDYDNYDYSNVADYDEITHTIIRTIAVKVNKSQNTPNMPSLTMNVENNVTKVSDITLPEGWAWQDADKDTALTVGTAVAATAVYTGADQGNYETESVEISITRLECTHATTEVKDAKDATCTEKGYTGDTYCKDCGVKLADGTEIAMTDHKWDAGKVTKEPTETAEGVKTYTCSVCGETKTEAIPKKTATTPQPGTDDTAAPQPGTNDTAVPQKGAVVIDDKKVAKVKVTDVKKKEVECKGPANKKAKTVSIPATVKMNGVTYKVTKIADNAFKNNKTVTKVTVGSNIKTIGKNAFSGATKLKTVKIGKNVTKISDKAFYKCTSLTKITIPSKVKKIGKQTFYGCTKLKTITIKTTKLTRGKVGSKAFKGIYAKATVKVPKSKYEAYKKLLKARGLGAKAVIKK
ncbi:MAG: leucine-rich repeat domain-containing protein, partial [Eubacterium sp.]|nr:leucine-rich repeat domain-containing protein [Eubacterium sp.]